MFVLRWLKVCDETNALVHTNTVMLSFYDICISFQHGGILALPTEWLYQLLIWEVYGIHENYLFLHTLIAHTLKDKIVRSGISVFFQTSNTVSDVSCNQLIYKIKARKSLMCSAFVKNVCWNKCTLQNKHSHASF